MSWFPKRTFLILVDLKPIRARYVAMRGESMADGLSRQALDITSPTDLKAIERC
jgi:hypothetical protein